MTAKASAANIDNAIKDYVAGESIEVCASRWHTSQKTITDILKSKGLFRDKRSRYEIVGIKNGIAAREKLSLPVTEIVNRFNNGESVLSLSISFGVSRNVIEERLVFAGATPRGITEANRLAINSLPREEVLRRIKIAQDSVRGVKHTAEHRHKIALSREHNGVSISATENLLCSWLRERGVSFIQQKAVGSYNVDIATYPIAVEILGGSWHASKSIEVKRAKYIFDAGWHQVFVWVHAKRSPITPYVADYIVSMLQEVSGDPSAIREYRVIRGDGKELSRGRSDSDNFTIVVPGYHGVGIQP